MMELVARYGPMDWLLQWGKLVVVARCCRLRGRRWWCRAEDYMEHIGSAVSCECEDEE